MITNLERLYHSREKVDNFFRDYAKMKLDTSYNLKQNEIEQGEQDLKY